MSSEMVSGGAERCQACRRKIADHALVFIGGATTEKRYICPQIRRSFGDV